MAQKENDTPDLEVSHELAHFWSLFVQIYIQQITLIPPLPGSSC